MKNNHPELGEKKSVYKNITNYKILKELLYPGRQRTHVKKL